MISKLKNCIKSESNLEEAKNKKLLNNGSRLKKNTILAAKKIRLTVSKYSDYQVPLHIIRKGSAKCFRPTRRNRKRGKYNWVYRWVYKDKKRILFRINLKRATPVKRKYISLQTSRKVRNQETIYIRSSYNNTIFTLLGVGGKTLCCTPTGACGFKNTRKSTAYASQMAAQRISMLVKKQNAVRIKMSGLGPGKLSGVKALAKAGLRISNIRECSSLPHNGCRTTKRRRL